MYSLSKTFSPLLVLLAIFLFGRPAEAQYGGGSGEPNDPYLIYTAEQMNTIGADPNDWDKHFKLMDDIDLSAYTGKDFNIIGNWSGLAFAGVFDGSGHTISNFSYISTDRNSIGFFGYVSGENAQIKDVGLINPNVDAATAEYVGSLVGRNYGTITNCYVKGGSVSGSGTEWWHVGVGGLVGRNYEGTIINSYATGSVTGESVGGLVGENFDGTITNCYSTGSVSGTTRVGGLVGSNWEGTITNCYVKGATVSGDYWVGGLVGGNRGWQPGFVWYVSVSVISDCYSTASVSGNNGVGGLVGINGSDDSHGVITNCYATGSVTGTTGVGGLLDIMNGAQSPILSGIFKPAGRQPVMGVRVRQQQRCRWKVPLLAGGARLYGQLMRGKIIPDFGGRICRESL